MNTRMRFRTFVFLATLPSLFFLGSCGEEAPAWQGSVVDSAGIAVVQNPSTPMWRTGEEWTVTEELKIGSIAGEPEYQFGQLAFMDVATDGTIYAMDMQAQEVRAFDAQGMYLRTIGGPGGGPGEIGPGAMFVFDDGHGGLIVPDLGNQRVSRYTQAGEPLGNFPINIAAGAPARWAVDSAGHIMAQLRGLNLPGMAALEDGDPIVVYDTTGAVVDTVAMLPKGQTAPGISEEQLSIVLFSPEPLWDLRDDGTIYYAMNNEYRIFVRNHDGGLTRIIEKDAVKKPVEDADKEAILSLLREQYQQFGVPPAQIEQIMTGIGFADFYPVFAQLFVGPDETLWVQRIRSARDMAEGSEEEVEFDPQNIGSPEWDVFNSDGQYLGVVTLPDRFAPVNVENDQLYGVWRDELDVQYIMRLRVEGGTP